MLSGLARYSLKQVRNLKKLAAGKDVNYPSFGSMTLDRDDVDIAVSMLKERSEWFRRDTVERYEKRFAEWNGSEYSFSFMGGRVALSACIYAVGLKPGDEVIVPGYTCVVVPNAFAFDGVIPVFSDIELDTFGLDASLVEKKIGPKTKAVLLHHLYGLVARDYEEVVSIAKKHGLMVIEDCAQATGAMLKGRKVGNLGDVAIYSSEQSKVFNTIQGGLATTNDKGLASRLFEYYERCPFPTEALIEKQLRCVKIYYDVNKDKRRWWRGDIVSYLNRSRMIVSTTREEEAGIRPSYYGCRMPAAIAALGSNQLKKIDGYNENRRRCARQWDDWCDRHGYGKPMVAANSVPVWLRYPVLVEPEKKMNRSWAKEDPGVPIGVWFVTNIHPAKRNVDGCPNADKAVASCINFPTLGV